MFKETLYPQTRKVLDRLPAAVDLRGWYLAGGTGLSLQLNHRRSADLDFFTPRFPRAEILLSSFLPLRPRVVQQAKGTLDLLISDVKVSFFEYPYPRLNPLHALPTEGGLGISVADLLDIGCMKLTAVSSRGSKKDFVDLYFLLQKLSFGRLWQGFTKKYRGAEYNPLHILKSLVYFEDAEADPEPDLIKKVDWVRVKSFLEELAAKTLKPQPVLTRPTRSSSVPKA